MGTDFGWLLRRPLIWSQSFPIGQFGHQFGRHDLVNPHWHTSFLSFPAPNFHPNAQCSLTRHKCKTPSKQRSRWSPATFIPWSCGNGFNPLAMGSRLTWIPWTPGWNLLFGTLGPRTKLETFRNSEDSLGACDLSRNLCSGPLKLGHCKSSHLRLTGAQNSNRPGTLCCLIDS